jgi:hypothetical protein
MVSKKLSNASADIELELLLQRQCKPKGTGITDDRATSNLQNPQNRQAWASFEGFEGGERFQAGLPLSPSRGGRAVTTSFGHSVRGKVVDRRYVSS